LECCGSLSYVWTIKWSETGFKNEGVVKKPQLLNNLFSNNPFLLVVIATETLCFQKLEIAL
jgi:hypothetical protein